MSIPTISTFNGRPFLLMEPHSPDSRPLPRSLANTVADVVSGARTLETTSETPGGVHQLDFVCETRADDRALEDFFDACLGSREGFWVPTWQWEFEIVDHDESDPHIAWIWIHPSNYSDVWALGDAYRYLLLLVGNTYAIKKVIGPITEDHPTGTGWERLQVSNLSDGPGWSNAPPFTEAKGYRPLWMRYVRLADDEIVTQELGEESSLITVRVLELPKESP